MKGRYFTPFWSRREISVCFAAKVLTLNPIHLQFSNSVHWPTVHSRFFRAFLWNQLLKALWAQCEWTKTVQLQTWHSNKQLQHIIIEAELLKSCIWIIIIPYWCKIFARLNFSLSLVSNLLPISSWNILNLQPQNDNPFFPISCKVHQYSVF